MGQQDGGRPSATQCPPQPHICVQQPRKSFPLFLSSQEVIFCAGMKSQFWTGYLSKQSQTGPCHPSVSPDYTEPITQHLW